MVNVLVDNEGKVLTTGGKAIKASEGSGGGSGTTDVPLTRVSDDNGNEIGTWYMNFEDANGNIFKVICLDAQYRNDSAYWCSNISAVTNMPLYGGNNVTSWWYNATESATENTQLILDYCNAKGYTSTACSHCRSKSFTINGTTYYGQLPNMKELLNIWIHRSEIENMDTSASSQLSLNFSSPRTIWSSTQTEGANAEYLYYNGDITTYYNKTRSFFAVPILEIPLT